ncbi:MAG: energy transducer TonB [Thermodesulfobacteriota bacterium]|nr:energy transducer TonB [Thermodesulfobacteriota bacterium]
MPHTQQQKDYLDDITSANRLRWVGAVLAAAGLNLLLFGMMPRLMDQSPPTAPTIEKIIPRVQVTHIHEQRHEKKREVVTPEPPEPPPDAASRAVPDRPVQPELKMPFEINPRLPGGPDTLELPPLQAGALTPDGITTIFPEGELDTPLTVTARTPPVYPLRARRMGIEGRVRVSFVVNESGKVQDIKILDAQPENIFEGSVRQCVSRWRFKPGTIDGAPVKTRMTTTIQFQLEDPS